MNRWIIVIAAALLLLAAAAILPFVQAQLQGQTMSCPSGYQLNQFGLCDLVSNMQGTPMGQPFEPIQTSNQSMLANQTNGTNFSQQIAQQISSDTFLVDVAYESPKTVILQGNDAKFVPPPQRLAFNDLLWGAVDLLKDQGFEIDQIDLLRTGESTDTYRIYMSHKE